MDVFGSGPRLDAPEGDIARQAVAALRGYGYQIYVSGLAWLALGDGEILYLEVAEDFAVAAQGALAGTQVKDTAESEKITLQSAGARAAIDAYVDLVLRNPGRTVTLHYLTTSEIGVERSKAQRVSGGSALLYWRRAAAGADLEPLRTVIEALDLKPATKAYVEALSEEAFRSEFLGRIHWDCGAAGFSDVRVDLEAGLVEYVASARRLSSKIGRDMLPRVIERVLTTATAKGMRRLRRADLLALIDEAALVAVPVEQLANAFQGPGGAVNFSRPALLNPARDLPLPTIYAPRKVLLGALDETRRAHGLVIATGATGLGKSLAARLVADQSGLNWSIVDFRNLSPSETAARLSHLLGELAAGPLTHCILDDVNEIDDPAVRDGLLRVMSSLRRRDATAIVTSYRAPSIDTLHQLAPGASTAFEVPYLEEDEVADLVERTGGDRKYAGAVHRAAAGGHPQLTMAALLHLAAADWSRAAIATALGGQAQSGFDAERRAVRQRLVAALSGDAQTLLLRASLIRVGFERKLMLDIAGLDPSVPRPGLILDQLIGPWIESLRQNRLRVSPLLQDAADETLGTAECRAVHRCIAGAMLGKNISILDAAAILHHALHGEDRDHVFGFAHSIITSSVDLLEALAPFLGDLSALGTDAPIFPQDLAASAMLRLAQLLVLLPTGTPGRARDAWNALERERAHVKGQRLFEGFALFKLLVNPRVGELFEDWLDLLLRFDRLTQSDEYLAASSQDFKTAGGVPHPSGVLFAGQLHSIRTVKRIREIFERLNGEAPGVRQRLFSSFQPGRGDISIFVNHAWLKESQTEGFDWEAAALDYAACAELAFGWGDKMLASRCAIAEAICLDENGDDPERAFSCLADAEKRFGFDIALSRARAKIHWRRRDHAAALPLLTAAAEAGGQDPLERAYIAREAGISAANLGDWAAAQDWFERAQKAAATFDKMPSVRAMSIGLIADAANAAFRAGRPGAAIVKMRDALVALPRIDPNGTLAEAHCHRVVRHGLLWLYREITGTKAGGEEEVVYMPGAASNTEPIEAIRSHPVLALDLSFYLLADADEALVEPTGFYREFRNYLVDGPILSSEISAAIAEDRRSILTHDPTAFVERVRRHASLAALVPIGQVSKSLEELTNPKRGTIPLALVDETASDATRRAAEDYLLSFAMAAALAGVFDVMGSIVEQGLAAPEISALHPLLRRLAGERQPLRSATDGAANAIAALREDLSTRPDEFCWIAAWMLLHVRGSRLRDGVVQPLIAWIYEGTARLIEGARFRLSLPAMTVPPIEAVLAAPERTMASAARLLLALAPAAATQFVSAVRIALEEAAAIDAEGP